MEDARVGQLLDRRYRIAERLAAGGMGVVYLGERVGLSKPVAIKFLHRSSAVVPGHRQRFEREAEAMSRLTHPNLVNVIDFGSSDGVPYLVMDYHPGQSLRKVLREGPLVPPRAVFITRQMLAGLASAHEAHVVHRDLKPDNVLLVGQPGEDLVKILDFGVAKLIEGDGGPSDLSVMAARVLGTPEYMSPEQARCQDVDHRADLYAVGVILYEMVAGVRPFEAEDDLALLRKHVEDQPPPLGGTVPGLSPQLESIIFKALEKSRDARWPSAGELSDALADTPEGRRAGPGPGGRARRGRRGARPVAGDAVATVAASPAALDRSDDDRRARRTPRRRLILWLILLVVTAAAAGWYAAELGLVDVPSWFPWRPL